MFENKKIIAIIPARSGSKGIKNKNIKNIKGKPLLSYSIEAGLNSKYIDKVFVSTDSKRYASIAEQYGADAHFLRPKNLSNDESKTIDSIVYSLERFAKEGFAFDVVVVLQPTSPLRTTSHIDEAIKLFFKNGCLGLLSVNKVNINVFLLRNIKKENILKNVVHHKTSTIRRQDLKPTYVVNGAIYINSAKEITTELSLNDNPIGFLMDESYSLDIDTNLDLRLAKRALKNEKQ